jgi:hypothetical protein
MLFFIFPKEKQLHKFKAVQTLHWMPLVFYTRDTLALFSQHGHLVSEINDRELKLWRSFWAPVACSTKIGQLV